MTDRLPMRSVCSQLWHCMSSRISTLSIIDALFTALLNTNYDQYVRNMADTCVGNRVRGE